jgi:hypothetical protein
MFTHALVRKPFRNAYSNSLRWPVQQRHRANVASPNIISVEVSTAGATGPQDGHV